MCVSGLGAAHQKEVGGWTRGTRGEGHGGRGETGRIGEGGVEKGGWTGLPPEMTSDRAGN